MAFVVCHPLQQGGRLATRDLRFLLCKILDRSNVQGVPMQAYPMGSFLGGCYGGVRFFFFGISSAIRI